LETDKEDYTADSSMLIKKIVKDSGSRETMHFGLGKDINEVSSESDEDN